MTLLELNTGESAEILKIGGRGAFRRQVMEMGLQVGEKITVIRKAPLNDPIEYEVKGHKIVLRESEARLIEITKEISETKKTSYIETQILDTDTKNFATTGKHFSVAFIGNCTSGKTSIFNYFTGLNERVGNYESVTQEIKKHQTYYKDYQITFIDMPGVFSLYGKQQKKEMVRNFLFESLPDVIVNVVDAFSLERSLFLTTDLIDSDFKVVMAINRYDEFEKSSNYLDIATLSKLTGMPALAVSVLKPSTMDALLNTIIEVFEDKEKSQRHIHINYGEQIESSIKKIQQHIKQQANTHLTNIVSSRFLAIKLLQGDAISEKQIETCYNQKEILDCVENEKQTIQKLYNTTSEQLINDYKYGFINGALKETLVAVKETKKNNELVDSILTHKLFGLPIFFVFMWIMFTATFTLGSYPMHWIESLVAYVSKTVSESMPDGTLKDLLIDGVLSGVGGVLVFLPNILILYFFISLMEDTGYMSRAVFIMDKMMHRIGLHGKSFIPLVMGFGCNVPAILATRMLDNKKERLITILINPFMSCNARLPVYILFISAFFPEHSGTVLFFIYTTGIAVAILTALILKKFISKKQEHPFVMELPPYRLPSFRVITKNMWKHSVQYLRKIGTVILLAAIIFWALSYFPVNVKYSRDYTAEKNQIEKKYAEKIMAVATIDSSLVSYYQQQKMQEIEKLILAEKSEHKELSYLGKIGRFIEPVIRPLGFDWRIGITILSGIPAKEIIISSLAVLYQVDSETDIGNRTLVQRIQSQTYYSGDKAGQKIFNPAVALAFMIFVLLYIPCIGTLSAIARETGSWKWVVFSIGYSFSLAWILAFVIYQIGSIFL